MLRCGLARKADELACPEVLQTLRLMQSEREQMASVLGDAYATLLHWSRQWEYPYVWLNLSWFVGQGGAVCDAGTGATFFPFFLARRGYRVHCVDINKSLMPFFKRGNTQLRLDVSFTAGSTTRLPFPAKSFDAVICMSVFEHMSTKAQLLSIGEFHRVLRPGGLVILTMDVDLSGMPFASLRHVKARLLPTILRSFEFATPWNDCAEGGALTSSNAVSALPGTKTHVPGAEFRRLRARSAVNKLRFDAWGFCESVAKRLWLWSGNKPETAIVAIVCRKVSGITEEPTGNAR